MNRKIRMGMIGGGQGAFIGAVHRMAAALDGKIELVCGAFSSNAERSKASGRELFIAPERVYPDYQTMIESEKRLPEDVRMDLVSIVTPNHVHYAPSMMALDHGFHVICDKPLAFNLEESYSLQKKVKETGLIFALTHNYTGYPMVKEAKHQIANGNLGEIKKVVVEYAQGWLSSFLEGTDQKQAAWRTDPSKSGIAGAMGDIGTHAENLAEYITGSRIKSLCADIGIVVKGRLLDDDGNVLIHLENGARGILFASQISAGEENNLRIKVYGEKGGLEWSQMRPNDLILKWPDQPKQILRTGVGNLSESAQAHTRIPAGHPEGYIEAFANIYRNVAECVSARIENRTVNPLYEDFPSVEDGVRGMEFIYKVIDSGKSDQKWVEL